MRGECVQSPRASSATSDLTLRGPRILFFSARFRPSVGGAEQQTERLAVHWQQLKGPAAVLTLRLDRMWPSFERLNGGVEIYRCAHWDLNKRFPRVRRAGLGLLSQLVIAVQITTAIRRLAPRFDILHAVNLSSPWTAIAVRAARGAGLGIVLRPASTASLFDLRLVRQQRLWGRWAFNAFLHDSHYWQASSQAVRDELIAAGVDSRKIVHIPTAVTIPRASATLPERASRFLHLGRLAVQAPRDITGLLEAFDRAAASRPDLELAIVGDGELLEMVRGEAARLSVSKRVQVPGFGDPETWLNWAHCVIQPSFVEGMSNSLLEAMAAGLSCIAYDIQPNREALGDGGCGILVQVGDRARLYEALVAVADTPGQARALGAAARARAESVYASERIIGQLAEIYDQVMAEL